MWRASSRAVNGPFVSGYHFVNGSGRTDLGRSCRTWQTFHPASVRLDRAAQVSGGRSMANSGDGSGSTRGRTGMVIDAVSGVIIDAKGVVTPLPKAAAKE